MDKYGLKANFYDMEKKTGIVNSTFRTANLRCFGAYTIDTVRAIAFYCNVDLGLLVNDMNKIDRTFNSNLEILKKDLIINQRGSTTYKKLKDSLPLLVQKFAQTEIESLAYMTSLKAFLKKLEKNG